MKIYSLTLFLSLCLIFLQFSIVSPSLSQVWERFMTFSCEFSADVEKLIPTNGKERSGRSILAEEPPDFDDPEEFFNYLYPLADFSHEDLVQEAQRSSSSFHQSNTLYVWAQDLASLWLQSCRSHTHTGNRDKNDDNEKDSSDQNLGNTTPSPLFKRRRRNVVDENLEGINYRTGNLSYGKNHSHFVRSSSSSGVYSQRSLSEAGVNPRNTNREKKSKRRRRPSSGESVMDRKLLNLTMGLGDPTTTTTTTTPAPETSDDNFFTSYGGDIEYFFPLLSFGIPFDGEITFLGFHGFKGLFPYK